MRTHIVHVPGDKSVSHRALMFAALADGESRLSGLLAGEDPQSTAQVLRGLGCDIAAFDERGAEIRVRGVGLHGLRSPDHVLDCGNSGTTARLILGILAGQSRIRATLTGDDSLRSRPMRRVTEPLAKAGAHFRELGAPDRLPIEVHGAELHPIVHHSSKSSAQVKSALLLAGLSAGVPVRVEEPTLSRDHTERMLLAMGARVRTHIDESVHIELDPAARLAPLDLDVPRDFSSAAFFIAHALLADELEVRLPGVGLNRTRTGMLEVLRRMGATVELNDVHDRSGEPVGEVVARSSYLRATTVEPSEIPALIDEIPALAVLAARTHGTTIIRGAGELRVKESDRLAAIAQNLRAIGVEAEEQGDDLHITGTDKPLVGSVRTFADHRIAMSFGVLGQSANADIDIDDRDCVRISYPAFWQTLQDLS